MMTKQEGVAIFGQTHPPSPCSPHTLPVTLTRAGQAGQEPLEPQGEPEGATTEGEPRGEPHGESSSEVSFLTTLVTFHLDVSVDTKQISHFNIM
ncbi:hypothetical protein E2C01_011743 [Portunus trituberculatus]|uniref:Uncharacterized protein n=1 Tax=Portunus trituberculatus TaxID=210409 RepID=A0A5B7DBX4_PORTR|nr:hypothetical protein [Portunus trituberculatus]